MVQIGVNCMGKNEHGICKPKLYLVAVTVQEMLGVGGDYWEMKFIRLEFVVVIER